MPDASKPKCPSCETELVLIDGKIPDKCPKPECGFVLKGYAGFKQWLATALKELKPAKPANKKDDDDDDSPFSSLAQL